MQSALASRRRKSGPYQSAMSMLTFYINRAGGNLSARQRHVLERAKGELHILFGRAERAARTAPRRAEARAPAVGQASATSSRSSRSTSASSNRLRTS